MRSEKTTTISVVKRTGRFTRVKEEIARSGSVPLPNAGCEQPRPRTRPARTGYTSRVNFSDFIQVAGRNRSERVSSRAGYFANPMNNSLPFKLVAVCCLAAVILSFVSAAKAADHTRTRSGTFESSNGNSGSFSSTTTRGKGHKHTDGSWTNQNGGTGTHQADRTWDKSAGTGSFSSSTTTPNGKSLSREGTVTKTGDGTYQADGSFTRANGKTGTFDATTTKSATGSETKGTVTGANGKQSSYDTQVTRSGSDIDRTTTVTGPNGKTEEKTVDTHFNGDGTGTRSVEVTKPSGDTETRTEMFSVTKG